MVHRQVIAMKDEFYHGVDMKNFTYEWGSTCPECGEGDLVPQRERPCHCFIHAPCAWCEEFALQCDKCGFIPDEYLPYIYRREY